MGKLHEISLLYDHTSLLCTVRCLQTSRDHVLAQPWLKTQEVTSILFKAVRYNAADLCVHMS